MIPEKKCTKCGDFHPLTEFREAENTRDGLTGQCKACEAAYNRAYRLKHREKINAYQRQYGRDNAERRAAYKKKYDQANKEKRAAYARKYREQRHGQVPK